MPPEFYDYDGDDWRLSQDSYNDEPPDHDEDDLDDDLDSFLGY